VDARDSLDGLGPWAFRRSERFGAARADASSANVGDLRARFDVESRARGACPSREGGVRMRRFELVEGKSSKFWEIELSGDSFEVRWGRIGTSGQSQTKSFPTAAKAQAEHDKLVAEKVKKGYSEVGGGEAKSASGAAAAASATSAATKSTASAAKAASPTSASSPSSTASTASGATAGSGAASGASATSASSPTATAPSPSAPTASSASAQAMQANVGEVVWDDAARKLVVAVRGFSAVAPKIELAKSWARLSAQGKKLAELGPHDVSTLVPRAAVVAATDRLCEATPPNAAAELDVEGALLALSDWTGNWSHNHLDGEVVDVWIATGGIEHALRCAAHSATWSAGTVANGRIHVFTQRGQGNRQGILVGVVGPWERLREHVAALDEGAYANAVKVAAELYASASDEAKVGLAFVFPDQRAWAEERARSVLTSGSHYGEGRAALLASLRDVTVARELVASVSNTYVFRLGRGSNGFESVALTVLALQGVDAAPVLDALAERAAGSDDARDLASALARIGTPAALAALAKRADQKEYLPAIGEALARFPSVGLAALAPLALGRGKTVEPVVGLLKALVRREGDALRPAIEALPDAPRNVVEQLLTANAPKDEASVDELPEVLRAPRWLGKRKAGPPTIKGLEARVLAPELVWAPGQREEWRGKYGEIVSTEKYVEMLARHGRPNLPTSPEGKDLVAFLEGKDLARPGALAALEAIRKNTWRLYTEAFACVRVPVVLRMLELHPIAQWYSNEAWMKAFAGVHGLDALPVLRLWAGSEPGQALELLRPFGDVELAVVAANSLGKKTLRADAERWLLAHPRHAAAGVLPVVFGKAGKARDAALAALRLLDAHGHRAVIQEEAEALGAEVGRALASVFDFDELDLLPSKMPAMPSFWSAGAFARPVLKSGKALPLSAVEHLGSMLALGKDVAEPYAGVARVKDACTAESLADFAWDLFQAWSLAGWPSKEGWGFLQLGWLGDDACVRKLVPLVRAWPGESAHARAVTGLDVLAAIGTDVALMHLNGIAEKLKFKGLQEKAREKIAAIAEARGLSAVELADRLVPDLGLDDDGSRTLDFGERSFRVGFDEALRPFVREADGKPLADLPKPKKTDDAEKSKAATEIWKALKKDAKTIASQQVSRLELAMVDRRRWNLATFQTFLVDHPLVSHLVRRLIWGVYDGVENGSGGTLARTFRVAEDRSFADANDEPIELTVDAQIGVVHVMELPASDAANFGQVLADYEILQPFAQLARETFALTPDEASAKELKRFDGVKVPTGRVLGLESRGWRRGDPQDGGGIWWMERKLPGLPLTAVLDLEPGIIVGAVTEFPEQTLHAVYVSKSGYVWQRERVQVLGELPAIAVSELLRDLEALRA